MEENIIRNPILRNIFFYFLVLEFKPGFVCEIGKSNLKMSKIGHLL